MKKLIFTSLMFCLCITLFSQTETSQDESVDVNTLAETKKASFESRMTAGDYGHLTATTMPGQQMMSVTVASALANRRLSYDEIKGSPYLNAKPVNGIVIFNNGDEITNVPIKVDIYSQSVVATNVDGKEIALSPQEYKTILLPYNNQILTLEKVHKDKPDVFCAVLYEDSQLIFFREDYATFRDATTNGISDTEASFITRKNYFIIYKRSKTPTKIKLKEKYISKAFPKRKASSLLKYAKKNNLKLQSEEDFINLFLGTKTTNLKS